MWFPAVIAIVGDFVRLANGYVALLVICPKGLIWGGHWARFLPELGPGGDIGGGP